MSDPGLVEICRKEYARGTGQRELMSMPKTNICISFQPTGGKVDEEGLTHNVKGVGREIMSKRYFLGNPPAVPVHLIT